MHQLLVEHYLELRTYLVAHPAWILFLFWFLAALEGIAVIGAVIPGVALIFALSVLAGTVDLDPTETIIVAAIGAICGDGLSYGLGHRFKHRIEKIWPFSTHPQWLESSEAFVKKHGGKSLILGRFIGPLRAFVPMATGIFEMPFRRYIMNSLFAAAAWAPLHILPGYAIGAAATDPNLPGEDQMLFFGILLILAAVLTWLLPWLVDLTESWRRRLAPENTKYLYDADGAPENQWAALAIAAISFICFSLTAFSLHCWHPFDYAMGKLLYSLRQPALDHVFMAFSLLGDRPALFCVGGIVTCWLTLRREWHTLVYLVVVAAICLFVPAFFKNLFATPRPQFLADVPESFAFPSGHAATSVVAWGFLYMVVARQMQRELRPWLLASVLIVIIFTCASRLYLGVHWISDVVGGVTLGCGALAVVRWGWYRGPGLQMSHWESSAAVIGAIVISFYMIVMPAWPYASLNYAPRQVPGVVFKKPGVKEDPGHKHHHHKVILP